ncbi:MAG: hypothetical protein Tsb007_00410 [Rhizobacter sp.]
MAWDRVSLFRVWARITRFMGAPVAWLAVFDRFKRAWLARVAFIPPVVTNGNQRKSCGGARDTPKVTDYLCHVPPPWADVTLSGAVADTPRAGSCLMVTKA